MMLAWADQEEQEHDRFPRHKDNNQKRSRYPRSDKGQRNFDKKQKPKDTVATMEWGQKSKKGNPQDDFQKLLERPCPLHPKGKHTIIECINLRKSLQQRQLEEDKKKKDKQDDEDGNKDGTMGFQQPTNWVNMIYGGDSSFNRRNQKLV